MKARLLKANLAGPDDPFFCLHFPDIDLFSESGRDGQVYRSTDNRSDFWSDKPSVAEVEVPFDIVARLYCSMMNFRIDEFRRADHELWNKLGSKAVRSLLRPNSEKVSSS